jgi:hypothetical protein
MAVSDPLDATFAAGNQLPQTGAVLHELKSSQGKRPAGNRTRR